MIIDTFLETINSKDLTTVADEIIDFFKKDIDYKEEQSYEFGELIGEFITHHQLRRKFDKIVELAAVLKEYQPKIYTNHNTFLNNALFKYYCFKGDKENLKLQVEDVLKEKYDYDIFFIGVKQMLYNQHKDIVNSIIEKEYQNIKNSSDLMGGAEFDFAKLKASIEFDTFLNASEDGKDFDWNGYSKVMRAYDFNFDETYLNNRAKGFADNSMEVVRQALTKFPSEKTYILGTLETVFVKMMLQKNCPSYISSLIWDRLLPYFTDKKSRNWKSFFSFGNNFEQFLARQGGMILDLRLDVFLLSWGSCYVLDFFHQYEIISTRDYKRQQKMLQGFKHILIKHSTYSIWRYSFVHQWLPDEGTSSEAWESEKATFRKSFELEQEPNPFELVLDDVWDENEKVENEELWEELWENIEEEEEAKIEAPKPKLFVPNRKIGRNEKVTVKYKDGTIKKDVKYKKVMHDIQNKKCELVE